MGRYGGSMKNIAIGCADGPVGKKLIHDAPDNDYRFRCRTCCLSRLSRVLRNEICRTRDYGRTAAGGEGRQYTLDDHITGAGEYRALYDKRSRAHGSARRLKVKIEEEEQSSEYIGLRAA